MSLLNKFLIIGASNHFSYLEVRFIHFLILFKSATKIGCKEYPYLDNYKDAFGELVSSLQK